MRRKTLEEWIFAGCLATLVLLGITWVMVTPLEPEEPAALETPAPPQMEEIPPVVATASPVYDETQTVILAHNGQNLEMDWQTYLIGVVLAEMPASFEPAALEAQAVATRTFLARRTENPKHETAHVCSSSTCCQAYSDETTMALRLGDDYPVYLEKVTQAVSSTDGQVLTYDGQLIEAVYFACSGGMTEDAVAVWGGDVPYLQSVESLGEEISSRYTAEITMTTTEFAEALSPHLPDTDFTTSPDTWIGQTITTDGGGVAQMKIAGQWADGTDLRQWLQLDSTNLEITVEDSIVSIQTWGYGHRVGMSQYGAQALALDGATYDAILLHYYSGVTLEQLQ